MGGFRSFVATAANGEVAPLPAGRWTAMELPEPTTKRPFPRR
jgi:hypothetical protein